MTVYRETLDFDGCTVLRDEYGEPPPGDPDGDPNWRSTQIAKGHRSQDRYGWEYTSTKGEAPVGAGWELNGYAGVNGFGQRVERGGVTVEVTYWRRRKP